MSKSNIRISVCMACFNGEKYITEQIDSILAQLGQNDELIISDDSSFDRTKEILHSFQKKDSRVILLENNHFRNPVYNFENALNKANGEYVFLADQDDIWLEGKVRRMLDLLQENLLVVHDAIVTDENKCVIVQSYFAFRKARSGFLYNLYRNSFTGCCMAFRRELLEIALPFPKTLDIHDQWLGLIAQIKGRVNFTDEPYILFRRHGLNFTPAFQSKNSLFKKAKMRIKIIFQIAYFLISNLNLKKLR